MKVSIFTTEPSNFVNLAHPKPECTQRYEPSAAVREGHDLTIDPQGRGVEFPCQIPEGYDSLLELGCVVLLSAAARNAI